MTHPESSSPVGFWSRVKKSRIAQVLIAYLAVSWGILQVTEIMQQAFEFPAWVLQLAFLLLAIGLVIIAATAWVQAHPLTSERAARDELPDSWELEPGEITESLAQGRLPHLNWARSLLGGAIAFSLLFGFAGLYVIIKDRGRTFAPAEAIASDAGLGLAVLPFTVSGGELDEWREGMVNLLSTNLDGAAGLRAINGRTVLARWDELVGDASRVDESTSLKVAEATGARFALLGSAVGIGPRVRLAADIYEVETGKTLGQASVEGSPDSVLTLVDQLSIEVIRSIMGSGQSALPVFDLASITTASVPAMKAFLEGEAAFYRANYDAAVVAYERAVQIDTMFALAFSRLADAYGWKEYAAHPLVLQNRQRSLELVDRLPERQALLIRADAATGTFEAVELAEEAVRRYPDDPGAWYALGEVRYHQANDALASWEETDEAFARAVALDPSFAPYQAHGIDLAFTVADSGLVARRMAEYANLVIQSDELNRIDLAMALAYGDSAARAAARLTLEALPAQGINQYVATLNPDARLWFLWEEALDVLERRDELNGFNRWQRAIVSLKRGAVAESLERMEEPGVLPFLRTCWFMSRHFDGLPMDADRLESAAGLAAVDTTSVWGLRCGAAHAAVENRWSDHEFLVEKLEALSEQALAEGDTGAARVRTAQANWARGIGEWKQGRPEAGFALMEEARRGAGFTYVPAFAGDLLMQIGDYSAAVRHYKTDWTGPLTRLKLARAYEMLGENEKAHAAYAYFVEAWADADPELQPMVEEAKRSMVRLRGDY
jgi:tetratricopeptide (TPR) repeat protein